MASDITDQDSELRESVLNHLKFRARGSKSSSEIERAIADALSVFHGAAAQFARDFNDTRPRCPWDTLPAELKLEIVHRLPLSHRAKLLGVSHDMRALLLSDPSMWTSITTPSLSDVARAEFLRTMLARSGNCPLDIIWTDRWDFLESSPAPPRDAILQELPRVKTLTLELSYFGPGPGKFWAYAAPMLEKLTFSFLNYLIMHQCTISPDVWSGRIVPALRELKLPTILIDGPPHSSFETVLSLHIGIAETTTGIQWLWDWFPRLQNLTASVCGNDAPLIPAPPASVRHVILHPAVGCTDPLRVLGRWNGHAVRRLELYCPYDTLDALPRYLDPAKPWRAAFTPASRQGRHRRYTTVVRAGEKTVAIWTYASHDQRQQIHTPGLMERVQALTLGAGVLDTAFRGGVAFPALRALTVVGSSDFGAVLYDPRLTMRAPALQELIIYLASENSANVSVGLVPGFVSHIQHTSRLRGIVIRLSDNVDRHSPEISDTAAQLEAMALQVRIEYHRVVQCRQDPCICSAIQV